MKKIFIFTSLLFLLPFSVKAINIEVDYIDNVYSNRPVNNQVLSGQLGYIYADKNLAYCLDPSLLIATGEGKYAIDETYLEQNLTEEEINYINLVAHFGYGFASHKDEYYYMAAQELIWEKIYNKDFYWTDQEYPNGNKIDIDKYKKEIEYLIENKPFINQSVKGKINEEIVLEDKTNTLKYYDIIPIDDLEISKKDNKLIIKASKSGDYEIKLEHKNNENKSNLIYSSANHQTIGLLGNDILLESKFKITIEEEKQPEVIEDVLPNTENTDINKNISSICLLCLGLYLLRKS